MRQFSFACIGFCLLTTISHAEEGVYIVTYVYENNNRGRNTIKSLTIGDVTIGDVTQLNCIIL